MVLFFKTQISTKRRKIKFNQFFVGIFQGFKYVYIESSGLELLPKCCFENIRNVRELLSGCKIL